MELGTCVRRVRVKRDQASKQGKAGEAWQRRKPCLPKNLSVISSANDCGQDWLATGQSSSSTLRGSHPSGGQTANSIQFTLNGQQRYTIDLHEHCMLGNANVYENREFM